MHGLSMKHSDFISSNAIENAARVDECSIYEDEPWFQTLYLYVCFFILAGLLVGFLMAKGGDLELGWAKIEFIVIFFFVLADILLFPLAFAKFQCEVRQVAWRLLSDKEAMAKMK